MKAESMIPLQLEFSGALLPVVTNEQGEKVVPLKPIVDVIGLNWKKQRTKVSTHYLGKRLGTCTRSMPGSGQRIKRVCIRLNRIAAYLSILDPQELREQGNNQAANFLEARQAAWGSLINGNLQEYRI